MIHWYILLQLKFHSFFLYKMAYFFKLFIFTSFLTLIYPSSITESSPNSKMSLATQLKFAGDSTSNCWRSLFELRACTNEIITFFLNSETDLSYNCCHAIKFIQHECWPTLLGSLGYTMEESDILEAYCDIVDDLFPILASPPPLPSTMQTLEPTNLTP